MARGVQLMIVGVLVPALLSACADGPRSDTAAVVVVDDSGTVVTGDGGSESLDDTGGDGGTPTPGPGTIRVGGTAAVVADGRSALLLSLDVVDGDGMPAAADTELGLASSLGRLGELAWSADGAATASFTAGTWPGLVELTAAEGWVVEPDGDLLLVDGTGVAVQLHTHGSFSEGSGTMRSHTAMAEALGLDAIWWTDHDYRYNPDGYYEFGGMEFEPADLPLYAKSNTGWTKWLDTLEASAFEHAEAAAHDGDRGLKVSMKARDRATAALPEGMTWEYRNQEKNQYKILMAEQTMRFWIRPQQVHPDAELFLHLPLSRTNGDRAEDEYLSIVLVHSAKDYASTEDTLYVPLTDLVEGEWTQVEVALTDLARETWGEDVVDLHAEVMTIVVQGHGAADATWHIDSVEFEQVHAGEELRALQREFLDGLGSPVKHLIGAELSHVTDAHASVFYPTDDWPFVPYEAPNTYLLRDAVQQVHDNGGVISFNHVFGTGSVLMPDEDRVEAVEEAITFLAENELFGCDMLEVGYRQRGGNLADFMAVWDRLAVEHGLVVTGVGTSDQHHIELGAAGNEFVSWVGSATDEGEDLVPDMRRGFLWFGDPNFFDDADLQVSLRAEAHRAVMGQVVQGATEPFDVTFSAEPLQAGWEARAVIDGEVVATWEVEADGAFAATWEVDPAAATLVRFEVHDPEDGAILYTNPIYMLSADAVVAAERLPAP